MKPLIEFVKIDGSATEELVVISTETFVETFAPTNSTESMAQYVAQNLTVAKLRQELECADSAFYLLKVDSELAGYLKLNFNEAQSDVKDANAIEIERIYVKQAFQGQKLGLFLINKAIEIAKFEDKRYVWLGVWEHNHKAISFYQRIGFVQFDSHEFKLGEEIQLDLMMKLELKEG
ncbi:GNAT family N-acetyltransferase [Pedobacter sp. KR3-3]|uniref:GNAT family N-acetyltransferase n=1 Tax=Pedobacter albus TaxID=3113905 RepID=A0ABU7I6A3_9SPHI|nr:GNAT family N-acetyltransferase [Pedobacter sp. KR3-3]MEE1944899.1 GNAT family N-acetyltransferase [Pedobacter sp. KR3-3]